MTEGEKMARYFGDVYYAGDWVPIKRIIYDIAKRTRLECAKAIEREKWLDRVSVPRNSVLNARWENAEAAQPYPAHRGHAEADGAGV